MQDQSKPPVDFKVTIRDFDLTFHTTWGLFSPKHMDTGTRLLLERIEVNEGDICLDLGCGYGPIGLVIAKLSKTGTVYLSDKDFVAVEHAQRNAQKNGIKNCEFVLSNAFDQIPDVKFDLIASNLPSNTGKELLQIILNDAHAHLNPGGRLCLVTVAGLRDVIKRYLREIFANYSKMKQGKSHAVAMAVKLR